MKSWLKYFVLLFCLNIIEGLQSFRCDYKYNSAAKGWFKHIVVPATWFDARLRCALEGAVLASPTTRTMKAEITNIVNSNEIERKERIRTKKYEYEEMHEIFTGIHATFSQGDYHTVEGVPLSNIPKTWAPNEPDNKDNKESCLTLNCNGDLADISCEETRPYVCYRSVDSNKSVNECGTTDPEYRLDARTNSCYKFHTVPRNFSRAFLACSAEGGHLAIINSETEATVLRELFAKYPEQLMLGNFWKDFAFVGFHNWGELWDFRTIHGETLAEAGYRKFAEGDPNNSAPGEYCGAISRLGLLIDLWCDTQAVFICEKNPDYPDICRAETEEQ